MNLNLYKRPGSFVVMVVLASSGLSSSSRADFADEGWGDLSYSRGEAQVESIPTAIDSDGSDAYHATEPSPQAMAAIADNRDTIVDQGEDLPLQVDISKTAAKSESSSSIGAGRSFGKINTARNTHGVMTEADDGVQFYVSPFGGMTSITGNTTVDTSPKYALGAQAGMLLTSNLLLGVSFTYSEQNLSGPRNNVTNGFVGPIPDVFALKSNNIEAGGKMFFLGRESRVRPFFGGGFGWGKSYLNYTAANLSGFGGSLPYLNDYSISQFGAFGELGAEVAITRAVVVTAAFKLRGVLSTTTSGDDEGEAAGLDPTKVTVGNSLSRSASYTIGAGLGIYF